VTSWFAKHGKSIRKLHIDLRRWKSRYCSLEDLEKLLVEIVRAVQGNLTQLVLGVQGAPLETAHAWLEHVSSFLLNNTPNTLWPHLTVLELYIYGKGAASQAQASYVAKKVLSTLPSLRPLRKVAIILSSTKLCVLPPELSDCDQIEELTLNFSSPKAGEAVAGLLLPAKRPSSLPLPPNLKKLFLRNPPFSVSDVIDIVNCNNYSNLDVFVLM
jgi:hypothetical protein